MRVLLADDQAEVRSALRLIVEQLVGYEVVGEAADAPALLAACKELHPEIVLLDWELPGASPEALAELRRMLPGAPVVALSARPHMGAEARAGGADAFVCKGDPPRKLIEALDGLWPGRSGDGASRRQERRERRWKRRGR
ncbi:MAG TPA: response regulator [Coriobacteriia bacterium]|jgi:DNA-binding NarL/FixJ family response regulator